MFKLSAACAAALILLQLPCSAAQAAPVAAIADPALAARIDAAIAPFFKPDDPGATIIVTRDGKPLFRKAYGMADVANKVPMTPDTVVRIGSLTKQFTATAILMLADEGKLAITDDITRYLPDYPTRGKKITIEHLLTHTSGIASYSGKSDFRANMSRDVTVAQMIDSFKNDPLDFEPGTQWRYNNSGYFLLGAIIEKVSGLSYAKFVEQRIFVPLGMAHTAYEGYERAPGVRAVGHTRTDGRFVPAAPVSMTVPYAAGSLVSTVDDMARWDAAVSSGALLKAATWQQAFTPYKLADGASADYGYGWMFEQIRGEQVIWHSGSVGGFKAGGWRFPAQKVYVAVLGNGDSGALLDAVASKAAAIAIGKPYPEFTAIAVEPKALDAFTGVYKSDNTQRIFRADKGRLTMERNGRPVVALQAYSANGFFVPNTLDSMEFVRDAKGEVVQVSYRSGDKEIVQPRTGPVVERVVIQLAPAVLDGYVGRYQLTKDMHIDVTRDGDRLWGQPKGQKSVEFQATSQTQFFAPAVNADVTFDKAADGVQQLTLSVGGRAMTGKKTQ